MSATDVRVLAESLASEDSGRRVAAAENLAQLGPECRDACLPLVRACGTDESTLEWASSALEEMGPPPREALPELIRLLDDCSDDVGYWAATLIGRAEQDAEGAGDALAKVIASSRSLSVRERAAWAAEKTGGSSPALTAALKDACQSEHARLARLAGAALESL